MQAETSGADVGRSHRSYLTVLERRAAERPRNFWLNNRNSHLSALETNINPIAGYKLSIPSEPRPDPPRQASSHLTASSRSGRTRAHWRITRSKYVEADLAIAGTAQARDCPGNPQSSASVTDTCASDSASLQTRNPAASAPTPWRGHTTGAVPSPYAVKKDPDARPDRPGAAIPHPWVPRSRRPHTPPSHS